MREDRRDLYENHMDKKEETYEQGLRDICRRI